MSARRWRNTKQSYGSAAIAFHWLAAAAIIAAISLGAYMKSLPETDPAQFFLFQLHKSIGLTILVLGMARLLWRLSGPTPEFQGGMAGWERAAARKVHAFLYALSILVPVLGWATVSAAPIGVPTMWFGLFEWPHLPFLSDLPRAGKREIEPALAFLHGALAVSLALLSALHAGAALKHHFWDRDNVLNRMLGKGLS